MIFNKVRRQFISLDLGFRSVGFCLRHNPTFPAVDRDSQQKATKKSSNCLPARKNALWQALWMKNPGVVKKFFMKRWWKSSLWNFFLPQTNQRRWPRETVNVRISKSCIIENICLSTGTNFRSFVQICWTPYFVNQFKDTKGPNLDIFSEEI